MTTARRVNLPTRDPFDGGPLLVTRLENPATGTVFEGQFTLGWLGQLTPEQLAFVGLLLVRRNNVQKLAADLGIAYNTARTRLEDIVRALGGADEDGPASARTADVDVHGVLSRLADGQISTEEADRLLGGTS